MAKEQITLLVEDMEYAIYFTEGEIIVLSSTHIIVEAKKEKKGFTSHSNIILLISLDHVKSPQIPKYII